MIMLTKQELKILELIARGLSSKEIAVYLSITFHTVESHRKSILSKTGVSNMYAALALAFRKRWIS